MTTYLLPEVGARPACTKEKDVGKMTNRPCTGDMVTPWLRKTVSPPTSTVLR